MKKKLQSVQAKILLGLVAPIVFFSLIFGLVLYFIATNLITGHIIPQYDKNLALSMEKYEELVDEEMINEAKTDPAVYEQLKTITSTLQNELNLENAYVMSKVDGKEVILVLGNADEYLTPLEFTKDQAAAINTTDMVMSEIYEDEYGQHKSTFLQIPGTDSILGLDADADFITNIGAFILKVVLILLFAALLLGSLIAYFVARKIVNPLSQLVNHTTIVASGDLSKQVEVGGKDEISSLAQSFSDMQSQLKQTILHVSATSNHVEEGSYTLKESIEQLTIASTQVSSAIQEIASSTDFITSGAIQNRVAIHQMNDQISQISSVTTLVLDKAGNVTNVAQQGNEVLQKSVTGINTINETAKNSLVITEQMNNRSNEVSQITKIISSISDQINLLALNAAIEAARAGEYGKGFAVVADEIRSLAEQSAKSATSITVLINEMQKDSNDSVKAITDVVKQIEVESKSIYSAGETFNKISESIISMHNEIHYMTATIQEIAAGSEQILVTTNTTVESLEQSNDYSQNIAASMEEQNASTEEMLSIATELNEMITKLKSQINHFKL